MKNKISVLIAVGVISLSGVLVFANNNISKDEYDPSVGGGCIDLNKEEINNKQVDVRGFVREIRKDGDNIIIRVDKNSEENDSEGIMTLESNPDVRYDIADVIVNKNTIIKNSGLEENLKISDIKENQEIEVKFDGPETRSYPVQANALSINIIK